MDRETALSFARPGERLDGLGREGMYILQRPSGFCFGMDSVLLAAFASGRAAMRAVDLGTGSGVLPLLICLRRPETVFDAVEIQPEIADMASRSVRICEMEQRIAVHAMDFRDAPKRLGYERYTLAVSNPPYGSSGPESPDRERHTARHEGEADIRALCLAAFSLLQNGGRLAVVFPCYRLLELMDAMRDARLTPKRVQLVHPAYEKPPNLALVEAQKAAKPMLHFLPPLFVRDAHGRETEALLRIYGK